MATFFKPLPAPKKAGRPPKAPSNAGRPAAAAPEPAKGLQPPTAAAKAAAAKAQSPDANLASAAAKAAAGEALNVAEVAAVAGAAKTIAKASEGKVKHVNWSVGDALVTMTAAVDGWPAARKLDPKLSIAGYAKSKNVPKETLGKFLNGSRALGKGQGRPSLLQGDEETFVTDVTVRHDRGRDALTPAGVINLVRDVKPGLAPKQATNLAEALRRRNSDRLTGTTTAQASTTKRTDINIPQQHRFFQAFEDCLATLRRLNTGVSLLTGQTFGELIDEFIFFGDETGFQASNGDLRIVGDKALPKHESRSADSRESASFYRVGSAAGRDGPTGFLPKGVHRKPAFTDAFLQQFGAPPGSTIAMTPNGYMTEEAWVELAPRIADGMRKIVDKHNPEWWALKVLGGYLPHTTSLEAMLAYFRRRILLLKEEAESSHVNQTYDQKKAIEDKKNMREAAVMLRAAGSLILGVLDTWALMLCGLHAIRQSSPGAWIESAKKVNLHPFHRVSFEAWCRRIAPFLQGGLNFKTETAEDKYALLPGWWHGMPPAEKKAVAAIVAAEGGWTPDCVRRLYSECHVQLKDMQNLRACLICAKEDPEQLDMGVPNAPVPLELTGAAAAASAQLAPITAGLATFMLIPKSPGGTPMIKDKAALFEHMVVPSTHLDIEMGDD